MAEHGARFEPPLVEAGMPALAASRTAWLARAVAAARATPPDAIPQHRLLVGVAGTGKSLVLRALADADTGFAPLRLPVELGEVLTLDALWTAAARALDPAAPGGLPGLLGAAAGARTLLLVDDFDRVLDRLGEEHWALRETLSERTDLALVGTCRRAPPAVVAYDGAFHDFFALDRLPPFTAAESAELAPDVPEHALLALHDLCRGNPRALGVAIEALRGGADVAAALAAVLDRATPEHRAVLDRLSDQARAVLLAVANAGEPAPAARIADRLGMPSNKVSAYLNRLGNDGLVEKVPLQDARSATGYQLGDRLLALGCRARSGRADEVAELARRLAAIRQRPGTGLRALLGPRAAEVAADPELVAFLPPELRDAVRAELNR